MFRQLHKNAEILDPRKGGFASSSTSDEPPLSILEIESRVQRIAPLSREFTLLSRLFLLDWVCDIAGEDQKKVFDTIPGSVMVETLKKRYGKGVFDAFKGAVDFMYSS